MQLSINPIIKFAMRKSLLWISLTAVMVMAGSIGLSIDNQNDKLSDTQLANIEALADGEISVVGCKPMKGATCYVFDGNGQLVDKQKNQYPGN